MRQAPHYVKFYRELWRYRNLIDEAITEDVIVPLTLEVDVFASALDIADVAVKAAMPQYTRVHAAVGVAPRVVGWALACCVFHASGTQRRCAIVAAPGRRFAGGAVLRVVPGFSDDTTTLRQILTNVLAEVGL